jgi:hypothetical protein
MPADKAICAGNADADQRYLPNYWSDDSASREASDFTESRITF